MWNNIRPISLTRRLLLKVELFWRWKLTAQRQQQWRRQCLNYFIITTIHPMAASPNTPSHHSLWELFFLFCRRGLSSFCSSHKSQSKKPEKEVWKLIVQCCSTYGRYLRYIQRYFAFPFRLSICNSPHSFRIRVRQVTKRFTLLQYDCTLYSLVAKRPETMFSFL